MNTRQSKIYIFLSAFVLVLGAVWIGVSRADQGDTINGQIPAPREGFQAPDFELSTAAGETTRLSMLRGQPALVNFWASWCSPCRAEMPAMERVYQDYQANGLQILAVNSTVQDTPEQALAFAQEQRLTFPILFDSEGEATRLYQVQALPTTFFIDKDGVIQEVVIGGPMSEALLRIRIDQIIEPNPTGAP